MKIIARLFTLLIILFACNQNNEQRNTDLDELNNLKEDFFQNVRINMSDPEKAPQLAEKYEHFLATYPKDSLCPSLYMELGGLYLNFLGDPERAIQTYLKIKENYPKNKRVPESLFVIADIYHDYLKDYKEAGIYYKMVIDEYPENHLASQAQILLDNLGKSPEQLLQDILEKNAGQTDTLAIENN